ncbi:MAG: RdgB/HAM1 family non-canonical purine NTP pyrophosphatase [Thermoproteota archaeon]|nr:RdgB/HAM1 family non-canonical purine NTP pyrophosphatase [Thermoproteota archaeon]
MDQIVFVSTNKNKFTEVEAILADFKVKVDLVRLELREIQSDYLEEIATEKAVAAFKVIKEKLIVEDTGLFIHALNDFPGPYSSFVLRSIGNLGIVDLLSSKQDRSATFKSVIAFNDGESTRVFTGEINGTISPVISKQGWGYDPVFIPLDPDNRIYNKTYGEMDLKKKNQTSHRSRALRKFMEWYITS